MSGNLLTNEIPELFTLKYLKKLNLAGNKIQVLYQLPSQLENLNLSQNLLNKLEVPLLALENLHTLDLSGNRLVDVEGIGLLRKLKCLYLNNNLIQTLAGLEQLEYLLEVDLSFNMLKTRDSVRVLDLIQSIAVVNIENNDVVDSFRVGFVFGSNDEFPKGFIEVSEGLYFRSPEKVRKIKSSRYKGVIKSYRAKEKMNDYASPDWGNSKIEDPNIEESFEERELIVTETETKVFIEETNEELFGKKVVNITKLNLENLCDEKGYEKSTTKPGSNLENLFEDLILYCKIEENKEKDFIFSSDKYENAISVLKNREDERKRLKKNTEKMSSKLKTAKKELQKLRGESQILRENYNELQKAAENQDFLIQTLLYKKEKSKKDAGMQTDSVKDLNFFDSSIESGLSSFSQLPDIGTIEYSYHVSGNEYLVHNQIGVYIQKLLNRISELIKRKKRLSEENKRLIRLLGSRNNVNQFNN